MQAHSDVELVVMVKSVGGGAESVRQRKVTLPDLANCYIEEALCFMVKDLCGSLITETTPTNQEAEQPTDSEQVLETIKSLLEAK